MSNSHKPFVWSRRFNPGFRQPPGELSRAAKRCLTPKGDEKCLAMSRLTAPTPYSAPAIELGDHPAAGETDVACDLPLKCRSEGRGRIIPDSTETLPECVWGDEGPING
jgi:hypothetical protein